MRKWAFFFVATAALLIGCAGSGDNGIPGGNGGGTGGRVAQVNLPDNPDAAPGYRDAAVLDVAFLTGQGRDIGDLTAEIVRIRLTDENGFVEETRLLQERYLLLRGYQNQIVHMVTASLGLDSRFFPNFTLDVARVFRDNGTNSPDIFENVFGLPQDFEASIRTFPGRYTSVPIFIDDAMITIEVDVNGEAAVFDEAQFRAINLPQGGRIRGFLSDYVSFDISAMPEAERPFLSTGVAAARFGVTGDSFALFQAGNSGAFEVLTTDPTAPILGNFAPPGNIGGALTPGTFSLLASDPTDLSGLAQVTALQGIWRSYTTVLTNLGSFDVISFPSSDDDEEQDMVFFTRDGNGQITNLYFGFANFATGTFLAYPIKNIVQGEITGELSGTITNLRGETGGSTTIPHQVRFGTYTFTGGTLPSGFANTGTFTVFRK